MKLVVVESPLRGAVSARCPTWLAPLVECVLRERNRHYAFACIKRELDHGRAPYASHALFDQPGLLDDANPLERDAGIEAGQAWSAAGHSRHVFNDIGVSGGMRYGMQNAKKLGQECGYVGLTTYQPLSLWRCVVAAGLRWLLAKVYR